MSEIWEKTFKQNQMIWGEEPAQSALFAKDFFIKNQIKNILIPGIGYGRNAKLFIESGITVTGIEISQTAIDLARNQTGIKSIIHHGSVADMPFDTMLYDGIFCYAVIHLLDANGRKKLLTDCYNQLREGGFMIFTAISNKASMYGSGKEVAKDTFEIFEGLNMFFYDTGSIHEEFGKYGLRDSFELNEPNINHPDKVPLPFITAICQKK